MAPPYRKVAQLKTVDDLQRRFEDLGIRLPVDPEVLSAEQQSPLAAAAETGTLKIGNRWCIHPMEGWDANPDGTPSSWTLRRWERFGRSGAKLIWGGEAAAISHDGRANPHQTLGMPENEQGLDQLNRTLRNSHCAAFGNDETVVVGLQLTHSGRFCRPHDKDRLEPRIAYHHPLLDPLFSIDPNNHEIIWTDDQLDGLIADYVAAARTAERAGFDFVDIKACHGYLLHEFLSARTRPGRYGGDLEGRCRLLLSIIDAIRRDSPSLTIGVRLSLFDTVPFQAGADVGQPMQRDSSTPYLHGFGCDPDDPRRIDLGEPIALIRQLRERSVRLLNLSCGSPYYNPHIQRPAIFPPCDGYVPPEDPLLSVERQIRAVAECKAAVPEMLTVGSGYSYLQDYLPHVAQAVVRAGMTDFVGIGRMVLSYPQLPADCLAGKSLARKQICRTFSDCTTAPRNGMISGCYPLDPDYKALPERKELVQVKSKLASSS